MTPFQLPLWSAAAAAGAPILLASPRRLAVVRGIDWHTLVFFAALFANVPGLLAGAPLTLINLLVYWLFL